MRCEEKESLSERQESSFLAYLAAVQRMRENGSGVSLGEFRLLWGAAVCANEDYVVSQSSLRDHISRHGC
jgi:hypothetical protein